jgi:hypothetical protein
VRFFDCWFFLGFFGVRVCEQGASAPQSRKQGATNELTLLHVQLQSRRW